MNFGDLDVVMSGMAASLRGPSEVPAALLRLVTAATQTIPGADHASITRRAHDGKLTTITSTSTLVVDADEIQYELLEGPCYDAVTVDVATYSPDLAHDDRWPRFGTRAAELGLRSQMAVRLSNNDGEVTGLNLYALTLDAFDTSRALARLFASHASVALGYATKLQTLSRALETRETIGMAIGIVMERYEMSAERAFEFLIRVSQTSNTKLHEIAAEIVCSRAETKNS